MSLLAGIFRILPSSAHSLTALRVMRAIASPTLGHLNSLMGASSPPRLIMRGAMESALARQDRTVHA